MDKQVYGVILAGGQGTRMGNSDKPKQFLEVGGRPILIHTVEKFAVNPDFQQIIVLAPKQWLAYTSISGIMKELLLLKAEIPGMRQL